MSAEQRPQLSPTGGTSLGLVHEKRWWRHLADRLASSLQGVAEEDTLGRRPAVVVRGPGSETWMRWFEHKGAAIDRERVDLAVAVDAFTGVEPQEVRTVLGELHRRTVQGGRIVMVERVVGHGRTRGLHELLELVFDATAGSVTLADVASVARPGESYRSTVVLELVRLGSGGGV